MGEHGSEPFAISDWTLTEVSSALSIKVRSGQQTLKQRATSVASFGSLVARSLTTLPVERAHFATAARFADRPELHVRGGDALHLAVAAGASATVVTLDIRMAQAAPPLGVPAILLS